jgi:hypothetical protein
MTSASAATKPAQIRLARRSPAYWRVTIDNPPINVMGPEMVGWDTTSAKSRARPAPDAILNSGTLRMGSVGSQAWRIRFEFL